MTDLLATVLAAHGGLHRWHAVTSASVRVRRDGAIWAIKGRPEVPDIIDVTLDLRRPCRARIVSAATGQVASVTPDRVVVTGIGGARIDELIDPRASFAGHGLDTPWSVAQAAYLSGYALWTYLAMPFLLARPGLHTEEIAPWISGPTTLRRLRATIPDTIPTHSPIQTLFVDESGLVVRHDYTVEIVGGGLAAQFLSDYVAVCGLMIPTTRRIYARQPDGRVIPEPVAASYDLSGLRLL